MKENKVFISPQMISYIKKKRKELSYSAYKLAELCGEGKYWINNIENGRTKAIPESSALKLYQVLDELEHDQIQNDYLKRIEAGQIDVTGLFRNDFTDDSRNEEGRDTYVFDAELHKKTLKKKINVVHDMMLSMLDQIDYNDSASIEKYEPYLRSYTALFTSLSGKECFEKMFKFPLHLVPNSEIDRMVELIKESSLVKYEIEYDSHNKPYLATKGLEIE